MAALLGMSLVSGTSFGFWCTDAAVEKELSNYTHVARVIDTYIWYGGEEMMTDLIATMLKEKTRHPEVLRSYIYQYADTRLNYINTALRSDGVYAYPISYPISKMGSGMDSGRQIGVAKGKEELEKLLDRVDFILNFLHGGVQKIIADYDAREPERRKEKEERMQRVEELVQEERIKEREEIIKGREQ